MLTELKALHDEVLAGMDALETIVSADSPEVDALAQARWKLTRASRGRRALLATQVYPAIENLHNVDLAGLDASRASDQAAAAASSRHIAWWTVERIRADWPGYQKASADVRASMRALIAAERETLYPLLERVDRA